MQVIANVFQRFADDLVPPFVTEDDLAAVAHLCGLLIPTIGEHDFPDLVETKRRVEPMLAAASRHGSLSLVWFGCLPDTRVNRYLGPTRDLRDYDELAGSLVGWRRSAGAEGYIHYVSMCCVGREGHSEAVDFTARNQRRSFLLIAPSPDHDLVLRMSARGLRGPLNQKWTEDFVYPWLCRDLAAMDPVLVRSIGWLEEGCEIRLLFIGTAEALDRHSRASR